MQPAKLLFACIFGRSGVNACTAVGEKLKYESLDVFLATTKAYQRSNGHRLQMWKADIDSAFRCALARCYNNLC